MEIASTFYCARGRTYMDRAGPDCNHLGQSFGWNMQHDLGLGPFLLILARLGVEKIQVCGMASGDSFSPPGRQEQIYDQGVSRHKPRPTPRTNSINPAGLGSAGRTVIPTGSEHSAETRSRGSPEMRLS